MASIRILAIAGLMAALSFPARLPAAEKVCDFQRDIVSLADYVLKNRAGLTRFKGLRYGAIAAYLKLRYAKLSDKDAEEMLMPLVAARVSRADELTYAWAIDVFGVDAAGALLGGKATRLLFTQGFGNSVLRAAVVKEGVPALVEALKDGTADDRMRVETMTVFTLLDKFDTYKSEIERQAEANGLTQLAAGLAATQQDPKAWEDFTGRLKDKSDLPRLISLWYWSPTLVGNPALKRDAAATPEWQKSRDQLNRITMAAALMPERDFLATYANQTDKLDDVVKTADTIEAAAADRSGEPWTLDRAWLIAYLDLLANAGNPEIVERNLKAIPFGGLRHYDGSVRDALDWMIAADALKPYVTKRTDEKALPGMLSADFAKTWPDWQTAADVIRANGDLGLLRADAKTEAIAAELMFAAGKLHALAGYITANTPDDLSVNLAEDFANRMDRICLGYLNFPAEGITYPDTPLFRFD